MSVREQERRQKEAERRMDKEMRRADKETRREIEARAGAADKRMRQVIRRIEKGDVEPRPLPGIREDSMESMESMPSMESMESMKSTESADYASEVTEEEAEAGRMMQDMPLEGHMPIDPAQAEEDLAQKVTEDTGSGGIRTCTTSARRRRYPTRSPTIRALRETCRCTPSAKWTRCHRRCTKTEDVPL